jgi:HK97 family phage prohead protease
MKIERKLLDFNATAFKFSADTGEFSGYASVFNGLDSYGDTILPGAYAKTLSDPNRRAIKMRWNHYGPVIGKWKTIEEDETGLFVRGSLTPGHSVAEDVNASLKHGSIDGLSIGFYIREMDETKDRRILKEIDLVEISVVEEPADNAARITAVKTAIEQARSLKEIEDILRDEGLSRASAEALLSRVKSIIQGDPERAKPKAAEIAAALKRHRFNFNTRA